MSGGCAAHGGQILVAISLVVSESFPVEELLTSRTFEMNFHDSLRDGLLGSGHDCLF